MIVVAQCFVLLQDCYVFFQCQIFFGHVHGVFDAYIAKVPRFKIDAGDGFFRFWITQDETLASGLSEEEARTKTEGYIALPHASEHTTGLAVDITSNALANQEGNSGLLPDLENYPEGLWLKENAPKFGFVLRYPKEKEAITGINFEPWHFRYVGIENAMYMTEKNLTLEEYIAILKQNEALGNNNQ